MTGEIVLVRARDSGVHVGRLVARDGTDVTLADARRVWRWRGANTLNELSLRGASTEWTRISEPVPTILVLGVCEVLPVSEAAAKNLTTSRWGK